MGQLLDSLNTQLKTELKEDAEDCLKIYHYLKETTGSVWQSQWNLLTRTKWIGDKKASAPSAIGKIFLKGLNMP